MTASAATPTSSTTSRTRRLLAHAAGTATEGASLAMACHAALCDACGARLAELESAGRRAAGERRGRRAAGRCAGVGDGAPATVPQPRATAGRPARGTADAARVRSAATAAGGDGPRARGGSLAPGDPRCARHRSGGWRRDGRRPADRVQGRDHDPAARSRRARAHRRVQRRAGRRGGPLRAGRHLDPRSGRAPPAAGRARPAVHRAGRERREAATADAARAHPAGPVAAQ